MIEASKRFGRVRRDNVNDRYWVDRFMFARRVSDGRLVEDRSRERPDARALAERVLEEVAGVLLRRPRR